MRKARAILAGIFPVVPEAGKHAVLLFVVTHWAAEMAANVADRLDLSFMLVQENVVISDPASELAGLPQFVKRGEVLEVRLSAFLLHEDGLCSG